MAGSTRSVEDVLKETRLSRLIREEPVVVTRDMPASAVIERMRGARASAVLVVDGDGRLAGIFTERDYLDKLALPEARSRLGFDLGTPVEEMMAAGPRTLSPEGFLGDAIRLMIDGGYRHIPLVRQDGRAAGLVSAGDVVTYIAEHFPAEVFNLPPRLGQPIRSREGG